MSVTYIPCPKCMKTNKISVERAEKAKPTCGACKTELDVHGPVVNASTQQLQKLIGSSPLPVIVDFWAPWCGPCRSFAPTFDSVAHAEAGKAVFVKVNTESDQSASQTFGIRGIPTLAAFKGGKELGRQSGALPREHFQAWVKSLEST